MKTRKETIENAHGLKVEVESFFVERTDAGVLFNDWAFDEYNTAKLLVYRDQDTLLSQAEEQRRIAHVLSIGPMNYLNAILKDEQEYDPDFVAESIKRLKGGLS